MFETRRKYINLSKPKPHLDPLPGVIDSIIIGGMVTDDEGRLAMVEGVTNANGNFAYRACMVMATW